MSAIARRVAFSVVLPLLLIELAGCAKTPPMVSPVAAQKPAVDPQTARLERALTEALTRPAGGTHVSPVPPGTRLIAARITRNRVTLNFNMALAANGLGARFEDALRYLTNAIEPVTREITELDLRIEIEGKPLETLR